MKQQKTAAPGDTDFNKRVDAILDKRAIGKLTPRQVLGSLAVLATIHATVIVPSLMWVVSKEVRRMTRAHYDSGPHPGAVTEKVFQSEMRATRALMDERFRSIEARIGRLEK